MNVAALRWGFCLVFSFLLGSGTTSAQNTTNRVLIPAGSTWLYYSGERPPETNWNQLSYHQSGWPSGRAQLGYGDGDEQTIVRTTPPPHPITAYFRHSFVGGPTNLAITRIRLLRDDGAVVYLNGREILRSNMPDGPISPSTPSSTLVGPDGENQFHEFSIPPIAFVETTNVVAVEVHQANAQSSDLSFDLELIAGIPEPPVRPLVSIETVWNTSEPLPTALVTPGRFDITRWERDLTLPLQVFVAYEGTASAADYDPLPASLVIAPGHTTTSIVVFAKSDELVEGTETVVARIVPANALDTAGTTRPYDINPSRAQAVVEIGDEDKALPTVSLETIRAETSEWTPNSAALPGQFRLRRTGGVDRPLTVLVRLEGTAMPVLDYHKFLESESITFGVGSDQTDLFVNALGDEIEEDTETVVLSLIYPPDAQQLPGYIISPEHNAGTVRIIDTTPRPVATLRITEPTEGEDFPFGAPIEVTAVAVDRLGYIPRVEFFADGALIGVSEIAFLVPPEPGTPITHSISWQDAPVGEHVLVARALNSQGAEVTSGEVRISVVRESPVPLVSVRAIDPVATELPPQISAIDHAVFEITRTGSTNNELIVWFSMHGTATEGIDYKALPDTVVIPAGSRSVTVTIEPLLDLLTVVEPVESVGLRLEPSPNLGPVPWYEVSPGQGEAGAVILELPRPQSALVYVFPDHNERFDLNEKTTLLVAAYHGSNNIARVEFLLDGQQIGVSEVIPPPEHWGGVLFHKLPWTAAAPGEHRLTARTTSPYGVELNSLPITIFVGPGVELPVVGVRRIAPVPTELWPNADFAPDSFEFFRSGPTNESLNIFFTASGTATPEVDYTRLENPVVIPAGRNSVQVRVNAIDDLLPETNETVVVTLIDGPIASEPAILPRYLVDPEHRAATVTILDNDRTNAPARIEIIRPVNGATFAVGTRIQIDAVAVDPNGYIPRLEFYAGDRLIGVSEIIFVRAPDPGTPIHHSIVWSNAPAGEHLLTARGVDTLGRRVQSEPIPIIVRSDSSGLVLSLQVIDPEASEQELNGATDPAVFRIQRVAGPTNEPVAVWLSFGGTAVNGRDYEPVTNLLVALAPGERSADLIIQPIRDNLVEGTEAVIVRLNPWGCENQLTDEPPFPQVPSTYCVLGPNSAEARIRDGSTNQGPVVTITAPRNGAVFEPGQPIFISAIASGLPGQIVKMELFADNQLLWTTNSGGLAYRWANAPAGEHTLLVRAQNLAGAIGEASIRILVRGSSSSFVERHLPPNYLPGIPFEVILIANPPIGTRAWAVEDQPPGGWTVSEINEGGVFDSVTGKVKFGHYTEAPRRRLTFRLTPPRDAAGTFEFAGTASADGRSVPVGGDRTIGGAAPEHHPADTNQDRRIVLAELTAYAAGWKLAPTRSDAIPLSYVTRAAMIWRNGEAYRFVPTNPPPSCWVPLAENLRAFAALDGSRAVRSGAATLAAGGTGEITISVIPPGGVGGYAVEEQIPSGWVATDISHEGVFDAAAGVVRWGLFMDSEARTLSYRLTAPSGTTSVANLEGEVSFDGENETIGGATRVIAADASAALSVARCEPRPDGTVELNLSGPLGQVCALETSEDLETWHVVEEIFLPDGQLNFTDDGVGVSHRFYRLRVR